MTLVGFKRATIGVFDETGKVVGKHVIEGKTNEGATTEAEINGLAAEATKAYGSDVAYYVSQSGTGDVKVNLGILDLPAGVEDSILGLFVATSGLSYFGEKTNAPYCNLLLESTTLSGEPCGLGVLKGKFSKESIKVKSREDGKDAPEAESLVFSAIESDAENETKGNVVGKAPTKELLTKLSDLMFGSTPVSKSTEKNVAQTKG
ncbi:major tail protein [Enterococcus rotai]|uniref:major tail protein n=1 Tax=Enterococcus rotai TaxID=118060 RepID=UPI0032B53A30